MKCKQIQNQFSAYLDGAITGLQMESVAAHLHTCAECTQEFAALRGMQQTLAGMGQVKAPADLGLKLRLAVSHETARRNGRWRDSLAVRWDNIFRPALLRASAGLASAVVLLGGIIMTVGMVAAPEIVLANDEPLGAMTTPHYLYSATPVQGVVESENTTIVVQAKVNAAGEIYDYKLLSGPEDARTEAQIRDHLMLQHYEPARVFGEPVRGQVLITFSGASVRG